MGDLLAAGLTVEHALSALIEQAESERVPDTWRRPLRRRLRLQPAHRARPPQRRLPADLPRLDRRRRAVRELAAVMNQLADHLERGADLHRNDAGADLPALVAVVALLVVTGLMVFVVPQVVGVFAQAKALPLLTRLMIGVSNFIRDWGWLALAAAVPPPCSALRAVARRAHPPRFDRRLLALPGARPPPAQPGRHPLSTLAILVGSGVPLLAARRRRPRGAARLPIRAAVRRRRAGARRAAAGAARSPPDAVSADADPHGGQREATGRIDQLLERAARLQQQELETRTATSPACSRPLLLLVMGRWCS